ncbi:unnamed protein product [Sphagnum balticum]
MERKATTVVTAKAASAEKPKWTMVNGQERAIGGQSSYGDLGRCSQTGGVQAQPAPHGLQGQGRRDRGAGAIAQHRAVVGLDEAVCQGCHCNVTIACCCAHLHPNDKCAPWRGAAQVCDEQRPPSCAAKAQGPNEDQAATRAQGPNEDQAGPK